MSITDGPICATNNSNPEASSSSYNWPIITKGDTIRIMTDRTPSGPTATGYKGEVAWDDNYIYICVATNSWKRAAISNLLWI